jgi:hypothetical protein
MRATDTRGPMFPKTWSALLLLCACASELPVASPKETGYGESDFEEDASTTTPTLPDAGTVRGDDAATTPATPNDAAPTTPNDASAPIAPPASSLSVATTREAHPNDLLNVTRPTDLAQFGAPRPVVLWANDACSRDDSATRPLFDRWAAAGFVVVSPYASIDQGLSGLLGLLTPTSADDHTTLIDWVATQNGSGPYAGKLDLTRVVVAGNGCGGVSALNVASLDARPAAVFVLSGSSSLGGITAGSLAKIKVPVGYVAGGTTDSASANVKEDYDALASSVPAILVRRNAGDHALISADVGVLANAAEIGLNWLDLVLNRNEQAYQALASPSVCGQCAPGSWMLVSKHLDMLHP